MAVSTPRGTCLRFFLLQFGVKKIIQLLQTQSYAKRAASSFFPCPYLQTAAAQSCWGGWASLAPCFSCLRLHRRSPQEAEGGGGRGSLVRLRLRRSVIVRSPSLLLLSPQGTRREPPSWFWNRRKKGGRVDPSPPIRPFPAFGSIILRRSARTTGEQVRSAAVA